MSASRMVNIPCVMCGVKCLLGNTDSLLCRESQVTNTLGISITFFFFSKVLLLGFKAFKESVSNFLFPSIPPLTLPTCTFRSRIPYQPRTQHLHSHYSYLLLSSHYTHPTSFHSVLTQFYEAGMLLAQFSVLVYILS